MCIIFGMIERNVACCHACSAPLQHRDERSAHLRTSPSRGKRKSVRYDSSSYRLFPERGETSSLSRYLLCSPLLITFPLLILVVLLRLVRLRSRPIPFSLPSFLFPPLRSRTGSATVTVAPDSPLFRRRRIFPRNRSTVHQFRRDVVARSLEENYRVQG